MSFTEHPILSFGSRDIDGMIEYNKLKKHIRWIV